ncbi:MAG: type IX secretion system outer membrane channel protein PorV [Bacteroidales bacterium]|jgi:hypothetical protein|nr:type IX secretion system outer membrane channel protein PorV [Bacteroidales bacterium]
MKKSLKNSFVSLLILSCLFSPFYANAQKQEVHIKNDLWGRIGHNVISTAVPFLLIAPDTRIGGMGETGVAVENDNNAQHWNPAKYIMAEKDYGVSVSYSPWLAGLGINDIYLLYASAYGKVTDKDAISGSIRYFSMGNMELTNEEGEPITHTHPHEFAIDLAYSRELVPDLSMAVTGRFIYSYLSTITNTDSKPGLAGAADISLFYHKKLRARVLAGSKIGVGLNISNIGNKISYSGSLERDFLPANFRLGIAYTMDIDKYNRFVFAFDVNKLLVPTPPIDTVDAEGNHTMFGKDNNISSAAAVFTSWFDAPTGFVEEMNEFILNLGIEYSYNDLLFIRTGYFNETEKKGRRKYMTFGVGIKYSIFAIDAAYILPVNQRNHPLQNTLRFSISFDFNKGGNNSKKQSI